MRLAVADAPDVVCLQELPAWSLPKLAAWSGYSVVPALADPPSLGPLPSTPRIGRAVTSLHPGFLRSAFSGQGNAVLAAPGLELREQQVCVLNPWRFRRAQARWLRLGPRRGSRGARRGVCARSCAWRTASGRSSSRTCTRRAIRRTSGSRTRSCCARSSTSTRFAEPGEGVAVAGDFNVTFARSRTLLDVSGDEWGFSRPGHGYRPRARAEPAHSRKGRRAGRSSGARVASRRLSDHTPVDVVVE